MATRRAVTTKQIRVGIYGRVSTKDKGQDVEAQLTQLRAYAAAQDWTTREFIDHETGKHSDRAGFRALFDAASRREIQVVLVWALDRFSREGVAETFMHIKRLSTYGVAFESFSEPHFRTTGPAGELMIAVAAWVAKQERQRISDRTKAGLDIARKQGRKGGRRFTVFSRDEAAALRAGGMSWRKIATKLGVNQSTIRHTLQGVQQTSPENPTRK
jgi:DNA invertase Pin-like site-specific DNA recombinase